MEMSTEASMVEGRCRKRDYPEPGVEHVKIERPSWVERLWEQYYREQEMEDKEDFDDPERQAIRFRTNWERIWGGSRGHFEDTTRVPPMRYTDDPPLRRPFPCTTLQVFSAKIAEIKGGFQWPLDVFGLVAVRDCVDQNRNIIFRRSRVDCQTLTEKDPYLLLTGPTRAVALLDCVTLEVDLKVKGATEREDKRLFFIATDIYDLCGRCSCLIPRTETSKFCTMDFTFAHIICSVEATISVRVIGGSWPNGFCGQFVACTPSMFRGDENGIPYFGPTNVDHEEITLLRFGDDKVPMIGDGMIELSRHVVSVQVTSKLRFSVKAWENGNDVVEDVEYFTPEEAGRSCGTLNIASCKMEVTVAWSFASDEPE